MAATHIRPGTDRRRKALLLGGGILLFLVAIGLIAFVVAFIAYDQVPNVDEDGGEGGDDGGDAGGDTGGYGEDGGEKRETAPSTTWMMLAL